MHIQICRDPLLGGVGEALKSENMEVHLGEVPEACVDIFVLCVDRDGNRWAGAGD